MKTDRLGSLSIFFIPYVLLEVPSNIVLKMFKRPSTYIGILVCCWGTIMTLTGVCKNYAGLMICRLLLGVFEAGFFPGAVYLITTWYAAREVQTRIALFYCASALSGAFSGLLAFAIARMDGVGNLAGWAWIFVLEGMVTVIGTSSDLFENVIILMRLPQWASAASGLCPTHPLCPAGGSTRTRDAI